MSESRRIAAVVLAAGSSSRLGRPKQTVRLGGRTLVERAIRACKAAELAPVIVVVRDEETAGDPPERNIKTVVNPHADEGMASSIIAGVGAVPASCDGVLILTCDQIAVSAEHLRRLCAAPDRVIASRYAGRNGVPAYFPRAAFNALSALSGDAGARTLLHTAASVLNEDLALDIDTEDDLRCAEEWLRQSAAS